MNFIQKCKNSGGFTLVELIVVIAILAILAGVAVPAYTGYIKKAEEAADNQILAAINTAFAAACLENGEDINAIDDGSVRITISGGQVSSINKYSDEFFRYFDKTSATFKTFKGGLTWDKAAGSFKPMDEAFVSVLENLQENLKDQLNSFDGSTFDNMGSSALLGQVDVVAGVASDFVESVGSFNFVDIMGGDAYQQSLAHALKVDNAYALTGDALDAAVEAKLEEMGATEEQVNTMFANAAVLYAAQTSNGMTAADVAGRLNGDINMSTDEGMANAALAYGMYTAYVNSVAPDKAGVLELNGETTTEKLDSFKAALADKEFQDYITSDPGQKDAEAYLAAMQMISAGAENQDAANSILTQGFAGGELETLLGALTGN